MSPPPSPNFAFLGYHDPRLVVLATEAERLFADDPNASLVKLRLFGEILAQRTAAKVGVYASSAEQQVDLLRRLRERGALTPAVAQLFHDLRRVGNAAVHEGAGDHREALHQLTMARELAVWFQRTFGNNRKFDPGPFVPPAEPAKQDRALRDELERLQSELAKSKVDVEALRAAAHAEAEKRATAEQRAQREAEERTLWESLAEEEQNRHAAARRKLEELEAKYARELAEQQAQATAAPAEAQAAVDRAVDAGGDVKLDEAATRRLIDEQLRAAGWEVDSEQLTHASGARPEKGKNRAIAEWPTKNGPADYVLFAGMTAVAVVEAKRKRKDVAAALQQASRYSRGWVKAEEAAIAGGPWGKEGHRVPFLYATNGRPYLRQIAEKSGIWFRDARRDDNHGRALESWHTPEGLVAMLAQDEAAANERLASEPTEYLNLRDYQVRAIRAVEEALAEGTRTCLVAMATGTGKTRTAIGLVYRLIKAKRFRRILFLVDRTALGEQSETAFKDTRVENLQTFADIFDIKGLEDILPDRDTKLQIATVQGMVKRILYPSDPADTPPIDQYDAIVVDECHRGYGLDREMSDVELGFRDLADYVSKYRRVLDHFDAVKIGLTATPALHTTEIFGEPTFRYSYREAVVDGCLVDHEPPFRITTALAESGIRWKRGEDVKVYDPKTTKIDLVHLEDEVALEIDQFNRVVQTENFNRVVCAELAKHIDPSFDAKTLVFAATDTHADMVVRLLKEAFAARYGSVEDSAVLKITGAADQPLQLIRRYKNERLPNVAVTVDLLTTGIDVPRIANLVFLRRVRSRILYEQMLGRATRLCPEIDKTVFRIFDAVDLYAALAKYSEMTPVVTAPNLSFADLVRELRTLTDEEARRVVLEQLVAKLQRKRQVLKGTRLARFEDAAGMAPKDLAEQLKAQSPAEAAAWFADKPHLVAFLDEGGDGGRPIFVSEHADQVREVTRGYGKAQKPDDYLDGFSRFLRENMNKIPALIVVTQRPRDLTRKELKDLQLALDGAGYSEAALRVAWREKTNADIAASILGFVRQAALGDPLVDYAERVDRAVKKILTSRAWTDPQRQWLKRLGKQLEEGKAIDRAMLDEGAFRSNGGFSHIDKVFEGKLEQVLGDLRGAIWQDAG